MESGHGASLLRLIFENIDVFAVILARMVGFFAVLPVFAGRNIPIVVRVALAASISFIAFLSGAAAEIHYYDNIFGYLMLIVLEAIVGIIIGYCVYAIFTLFYYVGQLIDYQIGFSMVSVFDPVSQLQVPITGNLYYLVICAFFVQSKGLHQMILTLFHSFRLIPPGTAHIVGNVSLFDATISMLTNVIDIAVRVSLPVVATILVVDVALGLLVKAVPQMNVFVVGIPIKLFIGLAVLYMVAPAFSVIYEYIFNQSLAYVSTAIEGMRPK